MRKEEEPLVTCEVALMKESSGGVTIWPPLAPIPRIGETILVGDSPTRFCVSQVEHCINEYNGDVVDILIVATDESVYTPVPRPV